MKFILTGLIAVLVAACGQSSEPHVEETIDDVWHKAKLRGVAWRFEVSVTLYRGNDVDAHDVRATLA